MILMELRNGLAEGDSSFAFKVSMRREIGETFV